MSYASLDTGRVRRVESERDLLVRRVYRSLGSLELAWREQFFGRMDSGFRLCYSRDSLRPWFIDGAIDSLPKSHEQWMKLLSQRPCTRFAPRTSDEEIRALRRILFDWIVQYAELVLGEEGGSYRDESVSHWRASVLPGRDLCQLWRLARSA